MIDAERALAKVQHLIAKAESTHSSEEARTCAVTAIQLIRKYKLQIVLSKQPEPAWTRPPIPPWPPSGYQPPSPPPTVSRWITSKFRGLCLICFDSFQPGDRVFWTKGEGCICRRCFQEASQ